MNPVDPHKESAVSAESAEAGREEANRAKIVTVPGRSQES